MNDVAYKTHKYSWVGVDESGARVTGSMPAPDPDSVAQALRQRGIQPGPINQVRDNPLRSAIEAAQSTEGGPKVKALQLSATTKQIEVLIKAGLSITRAIAAAADSCPDPKLKEVLEQVVERIEDGEKPADAMAHYYNTFDESYVALVRAGSTSGKMNQAFESLYAMTSEAALLAAAVKSALAYPKYGGTAALLIVAGILQFLVPKLTGLFESFGADLPAPTLIVLAIRDNLPLILGCAGVVFLLARGWYRSTREDLQVGAVLDPIKWRLPIFGSLWRRQMMYRWASTMAGLLRADVTTPRALEIAARASGSRLMRLRTGGPDIDGTQEIPTLIEMLHEGEGLSKIMAKRPELFPAQVVSLVRSGEQSGQLPETLMAAATAISQETQAEIKSLSTRLEVLTLMIMMTIIGAIIVALWMPILEVSVKAAESVRG